MSFLPIDRVMQRAARAKKYRGVYLAIVTDNKDAAPDNPGYRVKVKIPTLAAEEQTFYARIVVPMGGKERGTYFLPEKDDQLLIVFEHGDIHKPLIIGTAWSKKQEPPEVNQTGKNNTKLIKSRSGHRVIFDDKEGAEKLTVVDSSKKNKIVIDSVAKKITIECSGDIEIKAKQNVIMHSNALKIGTSEKLTGTGQSVLTHAASTFNVKASSEITVTGSQVTINVTGSPACQVSGSGSGELGAIGGEKPKDQVPEHSLTPGSGGGGGGSAAASGAAGEAPQEPSSTPKPDDDKVYVINAQLAAPGGNVLAGEQVVLLKAGTTEQIAGPFTTDALGGFSAIVPENTPYDVQLIDTGHMPSDRTSDDGLVQSHLHVGFFDNGTPLGVEPVTIIGPDGSSRASTLSADGMLDLVADPGEHQISIRGQTFHAHTLTAADLEDGGSHYEFAVPSETPDFEAARANRYMPDSDDGAG
jgi:hypothetical protein